MTPEAQAVLDLAVEWEGRSMADCDDDLSVAIRAYRESLPKPPEPFTLYMPRWPDEGSATNPGGWGYSGGRVLPDSVGATAPSAPEVWEIRLAPIRRIR